MRHGWESWSWTLLLHFCRPDSIIRGCIEVKGKTFFIQNRKVHIKICLKIFMYFILFKLKIIYQPLLTKMEDSSWCYKICIMYTNESSLYRDVSQSLAIKIDFSSYLPSFWSFLHMYHINSLWSTKNGSSTFHTIYVIILIHTLRTVKRA